MSAARLPVLLFVAGATAALLLAILAIFDVKAAAAGWLVGFVFWTGPPVGSLVWVMIHRLTGGRWGIALAPVFDAALMTVPIIAVLLIPALIAMPILYPWMHDAASAKLSVGSIYLNLPSFVARSLVAFAGWTVLAIALPRLGSRGTLLAAVGLVFYGILISLVPIDWILSLEYPFVSESFGASVAITQLMAALAWAAVVGLSEDDGIEGDLGGLLLAMVLAITYVDFMAVLVIWYGDLPDRIFWFVLRDKAPWLLLAIVAFVLGSVVPIVSLLFARVRHGRDALRVVGAIALIGLAAYYSYLIVPPFGWVALVAAALALVAIGGLIAGLMVQKRASLLDRQRLVDAH